MGRPGTRTRWMIALVVFFGSVGGLAFTVWSRAASERIEIIIDVPDAEVWTEPRGEAQRGRVSILWDPRESAHEGPIEIGNFDALVPREWRATAGELTATNVEFHAYADEASGVTLVPLTDRDAPPGTTRKFLVWVTGATETAPALHVIGFRSPDSEVTFDEARPSFIQRAIRGAGRTLIVRASGR